jgi:hypothetical protein
MFNLAPLGSLQAGLIATAIVVYIASPEIRGLRKLVAASTVESRRS